MLRATAARLRTAAVGRSQVARRQLGSRLGRRISRDQWGDDTAYVEECWALYRRLISSPWEEVRRTSPDYAERIEVTCAEARGRVLELGAGIGTMTAKLVERPAVTEVVAVEPFDPAVQALREYAFDRTSVVHDDVTSMHLDGTFDTVLACEFLEHLYADEEAAMLERLRPHVTSATRYVVSVPVGYMPDDFHVRGFTRRRLRRHLERALGPVEGSHVVGHYSQIVWGRFR